MAVEPFKLNIGFDLTLDTEVGTTYRQTGEDDYAHEPVTLLDAIVAATASKLATMITKEDSYKSHRAVVQEQLKEEIRARIIPLVDEAFAGPIKQVNRYGEPMGTATTMRELVIAAVQSHMQLQGRDNYNKTAFSMALTECTQAVVAKELAAEVAAAKLKIRQSLTQAAAAVIAQQLEQR